jgi:hypothetical protein
VSAQPGDTDRIAFLSHSLTEIQARLKGGRGDVRHFQVNKREEQLQIVNQKYILFITICNREKHPG